MEEIKWVQKGEVDDNGIITVELSKPLKNYISNFWNRKKKISIVVITNPEQLKIIKNEK